MKKIVLKTPEEIEIMRRAGAILREAIDLIVERVRPGLSTLELDRFAKRELEARGTIPAFLGLYGFPGTLCTSLNEEVVHGIPSAHRILKEGDIISLDIGLIKDDFYVDTARTVGVGKIDRESARLIEVTTEALALGVEQLEPGRRLNDLAGAIQDHVESHGFSVVREYTGHGIGRKLHEEPKIPNYRQEGGQNFRWQAGMVVCIEPMVNAGGYRTRVLGDKWTVVTADGRRSAHMEHTVAITEDGPRVLT